MEDERLEFLRKLLVLCKTHGVDLMADEGSIVAHRGEERWLDELFFVFSVEREGGSPEMKLKGCWDGEEHEVP